MNKAKLLVSVILLIVLAYGIYAYIGGKKGKLDENFIPAPKSETLNKNLLDQNDEITLKNPAVARYGDKKLFKSEVDDQLYVLFEGKLPGGAKDFFDLPLDMRKSIVEKMVVTRLVVDEAKKSNLEYQTLFKLKLNEMKNSLIQKELVSHVMREATSDKLLKKAYGQMVTGLANKFEYKFSHILVSSKEEAVEIHKNLENGTNFAELAKAKSIDATRERGGSVGDFVSQDNVPDNIRQALDKLRPSKYSEPIESKFGYHIFMLEAKKPASIPTFNEAKPRLEAKLGKEAVENYIEGLMSKTDVKYNIDPINRR